MGSGIVTTATIAIPKVVFSFLSKISCYANLADLYVSVLGQAPKEEQQDLQTHWLDLQNKRVLSDGNTDHGVPP